MSSDRKKETHCSNLFFNKNVVTIPTAGTRSVALAGRYIASRVSQDCVNDLDQIVCSLFRVYLIFLQVLKMIIHA